MAKRKSIKDVTKFEFEYVKNCNYFQQILRDNTRISYDWSYIVAWAAIGKISI